MLKFSTGYYRTIAKGTNAEKTVAELCDEIDRLRGVQTPPQGKTVRVRFEVCVDGKGNAEIAAYRLNDDGTSWQKPMMWPGAKRYTLTATLPVPQEVEGVAEVYTATNDENATSGGRG